MGIPVKGSGRDPPSPIGSGHPQTLPAIPA
jgi:hypothetical protein